MAETHKRKLLYVLSPGRSGSTLLAFLLSTHPEVAGIGERRYLLGRLRRPRSVHNLCTCGEYVPDCEFLAKAFEVGRAKLPFFMRDVDYGRFRLAANQRLNDIWYRLARSSNYGQGSGMLTRLWSLPFRRVCEANIALMDFVLHSQGASMFLDASKVPSDVAHMRNSKLIDLKVIHLSRDGRGRFYSLINDTPPVGLEKAAQNVKSWNDRINRLLARWEGPVINVKYEDLCDRPLEELRRIVGQAGLDPDGVSMDFSGSAPHAIGNHRVIRTKSGAIVKQEVWKTSLTPEQMLIFERIAGDSNRSFGYID